MCFMIPFPLLWLASLSLRRVAKPAAISVRREKPYSSPRPNSIPVLARFLRLRILPNAASRTRSSRNAKAPLAQSPSAFATRCFASNAPAWVPRRGSGLRDRFLFLLRVPPAQLFELLLFCAVACGQSRNSPRCDKPTFQNSLAPQTFRASDRRAKKPPGPLLRHRADSASCGKPTGKHCGYAARQEREKHPGRQPACVPRRRRRCQRWSGCSRRSAAFESLDRILPLRLGHAKVCQTNKLAQSRFSGYHSRRRIGSGSVSGPRGPLLYDEDRGLRELISFPLMLLRRKN